MSTGSSQNQHFSEKILYIKLLHAILTLFGTITAWTLKWFVREEVTTTQKVFT